MQHREPRSTHGPMDIDQPDPIARIAQFALPHYEEGPSRKRPHTDLSTPIRHGPAQGLRFDSSQTPFLFAISSLPLKPWANGQAQPESQYAGSSSKGPHEIATGLEDVEMAETPERPQSQHISTNGPPNEKQLSRVVEGGIGINGDAPSYDESFDTKSDSTSLDLRPIALGGMKRELRRREKTRDRQQHSHEHNYNFHFPPPGLRHTEYPTVFLNYWQLVMVIVISFLFFLLLFGVWKDVHDRMRQASTEILQDIAECNHLYVLNRCDPATRVPALDAACKAWEGCSKRDPLHVQRISVLAETFASVFNSLIDPLSWKAMGFFFAALSICLALGNSARRSAPSSRSGPPPYDYPYQFAPPNMDWQSAPQPYTSLDPPQMGQETKNLEKPRPRWFGLNWKGIW